MLDKIFNRKYLKAMKRLDAEINNLINLENEYIKALHEHDEKLEKSGVSEGMIECDVSHRHLDFMVSYYNHQKTALCGLRADLITYVS